jgi:hypothetical protein
LPIYPELSDEEQKRVLESVKQAFVGTLHGDDVPVGSINDDTSAISDEVSA